MGIHNRHIPVDGKDARYLELDQQVYDVNGDKHTLYSDPLMGTDAYDGHPINLPGLMQKVARRRSKERVVMDEEYQLAREADEITVALLASLALAGIAVIGTGASAVVYAVKRSKNRR